jgi:hypothetical protein
MNQAQIKAFRKLAETQRQERIAKWGGQRICEVTKSELGYAGSIYENGVWQGVLIGSLGNVVKYARENKATIITP